VDWIRRPGCVAAAVGALAFLSLVTIPARAGTVLFVVAEKPGVVEHHDSFVLPLSDPADIAHARDLIARGPDAARSAIVFAEVAAGRDGINRNVVADGQPLWDWHVSKFEGFGDFGIELIDGNPTLLQDDIPWWIDNTRRPPDTTHGHIGFWNYTVVSELGGGPVTVPIPAALPLGVIGLCAVVAARRWPGAPWRKR
jgi:hypothetical protein